MEKTKVIEVIADVLKEIQSMSGRTPVPISATTCPIGDLADFDSLNGVEATIELSDRLGIEIPGVNGFVNEQGTKQFPKSLIVFAASRLVWSPSHER
jgi:acyl carrier protein